MLYAMNSQRHIKECNLTYKFFVVAGPGCPPWRESRVPCFH